MARVGPFLFRHKSQISPHSKNRGQFQGLASCGCFPGYEAQTLAVYILTGENSLPTSSFPQHLFWSITSVLGSSKFLSHSGKFTNELSQHTVSDTPFNLSLWCPRMINYLLEVLCVSQTSVLLNFLVLPLCCLRVHLLLIICR